MAAKNDNSAPLFIKIHNPYPYDALFQVVLHCGSLAKDARLFITYGNANNGGKSASAKGKAPLQPGVKLAGSVGAALFPAALESGCGESIRLDKSLIYQLSPGKVRQIALPEILVAKGIPAVLALKLSPVAKNQSNKPQQFDLVQMHGNRVIGGCTFVINGKKPPAAAIQSRSKAGMD